MLVMKASKSCGMSSNLRRVSRSLSWRSSARFNTHLGWKPSHPKPAPGTYLRQTFKSRSEYMGSS
eukprot:7663505-Pyramimonas_sp.AAC.1